MQKTENRRQSISAQEHKLKEGNENARETKSESLLNIDHFNGVRHNN